MVTVASLLDSVPSLTVYLKLPSPLKSGFGTKTS